MPCCTVPCLLLLKWTFSTDTAHEASLNIHSLQIQVEQKYENMFKTWKCSTRQWFSEAIFFLTKREPSSAWNTLYSIISSQCSCTVLQPIKLWHREPDCLATFQLISAGCGYSPNRLGFPCVIHLGEVMDDKDILQNKLTILFSPHVSSPFIHLL